MFFIQSDRFLQVFDGLRLVLVVYLAIIIKKVLILFLGD
jgi:hypothetical protein